MFSVCMSSVAANEEASSDRARHQLTTLHGHVTANEKAKVLAKVALDLDIGNVEHVSVDVEVNVGGWNLMVKVVVVCMRACE